MPGSISASVTGLLFLITSVFIPSRIQSGLQGFYDPAPLCAKSLRVRYTFGGRTHYCEVPDYKSVVLPLGGKWTRHMSMLVRIIDLIVGVTGTRPSRWASFVVWRWWMLLFTYSPASLLLPTTLSWPGGWWWWSSFYILVTSTIHGLGKPNLQFKLPNSGRLKVQRAGEVVLKRARGCSRNRNWWVKPMMMLVLVGGDLCM